MMRLKAYTVEAAEWHPPQFQVQSTFSLILSINSLQKELMVRASSSLTSIADGQSIALGADRDGNDSGDSSEDDMNSQDAEASDGGQESQNSEILKLNIERSARKRTQFIPSHRTATTKRSMKTSFSRSKRSLTRLPHRLCLTTVLRRLAVHWLDQVHQIRQSQVQGERAESRKSQTNSCSRLSRMHHLRLMTTTSLRRSRALMRNEKLLDKHER